MRTRRGICYPKLINSTSSPTATVAVTTTNTTAIKTLCFPKSGGKKRDIVTEDGGKDDGGVNCPVLKKLRSFGKYCRHRTEKVIDTTPCRKRAKVSPEFSDGVEGNGEGPDYFDGLPDDLVVCILAKLGSSASCPADFISVLFTCKRFNGLAVNSMVLSKASPKTFGIKAEKWCESSHKFLKLCSDSGNVEASYTLGMIRFYCLQNRGSGASLMAKAAINSHAQALYSLAVIQFNGSGGSKSDKDLRAGVALCARAAFLGHVDALRELGHCLQDGYGVRQNVAEGRRFLVQANARELAASLTCVSGNGNGNGDGNGNAASSPPCWVKSSPRSDTTPPAANYMSGLGCPLLSDFGCNVPAPEAHPASRFLTEWYSGRVIGSGLRLCSHAGCGRPETRKHEFRRCSVCGAVNYCSRACQALDWKLRHKADCTPMPRWVDGGAEVGDGVVEVDDEANAMEVEEVDGGGDS